jgi:HlyD family secretion protein
MSGPAKALVRLQSEPPPATSRSRSLPVRREKAIVSEFQPDWIEIEERAPPRLAYLTLFLLTAVILCGVVWATFSEIDEIAVTRGKLITIEPNLVVQPLENAIIRSIDVRVGESVKAGQTLAVLDSTFTQADLQELRTKYESADASVKRLEAELANKPYSPVDSSSAAELLEARLYAQRKAFNDSRLRQFDEEIEHAEASAIKARAEEAILLQRLHGIREIEGMRTGLLKNGIGSKLSVLQAQDARLDIEANLARLHGTQTEAGHEIERARAQHQAFIDEFRRSALESLVEARARRGSASEDLKKADLRRRLVVLTAPADATVLEIAQRSLGSIIREAEPLLTLVPANVPLEAEVLIESKDIGQVSVGQPVKIKFDAFPFQKHGTGSGAVRVISRDAFTSEGKENGSRGPSSLYYKARIKLSEIELRSLPNGSHLLPGMAVQAEIQTAKRSVISYFLYPLIRGLDESIRER